MPVVTKTRAMGEDNDRLAPHHPLTPGAASTAVVSVRLPGVISDELDKASQTNGRRFSEAGLPFIPVGSLRIESTERERKREREREREREGGGAGGGDKDRETETERQRQRDIPTDGQIDRDSSVVAP